MKIRDFLLGFIFGAGVFALGTWFGLVQQPERVHAQENSQPVQNSLAISRYTLATGSYGEESFYAVKLDQETGKTWVLTGKKGATDDDWLLLPEKDKRR